MKIVSIKLICGIIFLAGCSSSSDQSNRDGEYRLGEDAISIDKNLIDSTTVLGRVRAIYLKRGKSHPVIELYDTPGMGMPISEVRNSCEAGQLEKKHKFFKINSSTQKDKWILFSPELCNTKEGSKDYVEFDPVKQMILTCEGSSDNFVCSREQVRCNYAASYKVVNDEIAKIDEIDAEVSSFLKQAVRVKETSVARCIDPDFKLVP